MRWATPKNSSTSQCLKEAQRFPTDYDGIIAGAPVTGTYLMASGIWVGRAVRQEGASTLCFAIPIGTTKPGARRQATSVSWLERPANRSPEQHQLLQECRRRTTAPAETGHGYSSRFRHRGLGGKRQGAGSNRRVTRDRWQSGSHPALLSTHDAANFVCSLEKKQ